MAGPKPIPNGVFFSPNVAMMLVADNIRSIVCRWCDGVLERRRRPGFICPKCDLPGPSLPLSPFDGGGS